MEIYFLYNFIKTVCLLSRIKEIYSLVFGLIFGVVAWSVFFVLQGIGLYTMAKKKGLKKKWIAFVPFVNVWYIGKLAGECDFFGRKVKHVWLYTMISQIITTLFCALIIAAEIYLFAVCGTPKLDEYGQYYWGEIGFAGLVEDFYDISGFIYSIFQLIYEIFMLILLMALYKKYYPKNYVFLALLTWFVPLSRHIVIFVLRNRKAIDYEAYMRARHEAYMRQQQQYRNTYGNPYNSYGNPYGNPYNRNPYNNGPAQDTKPNPPEDPFAEFSSTKNGGNSTGGKDDRSDDFFQ